VYCTYMIIVGDVMCLCTGLCCVYGECFRTFFPPSYVQVLCQKWVFRDNAVAGWETLAEGIDPLQ